MKLGLGDGGTWLHPLLVPTPSPRKEGSPGALHPPDWAPRETSSAKLEAAEHLCRGTSALPKVTVLVLSYSIYSMDTQPWESICPCPCALRKQLVTYQGFCGCPKRGAESTFQQRDYREGLMGDVHVASAWMNERDMTTGRRTAGWVVRGSDGHRDWMVEGRRSHLLPFYGLWLVQ